MSSLVLTLTESNVSVTNNTSDASVAVTVKFTDGWWAAADAGSSMTVTCNGTSKTLKFGAYNIGVNGSKNLGSVKFTGIKHNADGSKSVSASASWTVPFSGGYKVSGSASKTLTKIPRASSISSISGSTLGSAITVNITRLSSDFTHKVTYKLGSITRTYTGQTTSCTFTPPLSDAAQIPKATSASASISVQTYSGSTAVGSAVTKSFSLNVPASVVPSINIPSISRVDHEVPSSWGIYVKGISGANISISGAGIHGSTISTYEISGSYSAKSSSLSIEKLNQPGTNTFTGTVTDSRGRKASATTSITVLDYTPPTVSLKVERCNADGTSNTEGAYVKAIAVYSISSLNGKNSIKSKKIQIQSYTNTAFTSGSAVIMGGALSPDLSYIATITIEDALGKIAETQTTVPTGAVTLDFKSGGKGIAFGKVAESESIVDSAWSIRTAGSLFTAGKTSVSDKKSGIVLSSGTMSLCANSPYIDFYYQNATSKTSTIKEASSGHLSVNGAELYSNSIKCSNWFRSSGTTGWYSETYGGGIYMKDTTWVRVYNGKGFYCEGALQAAGKMTANGGLSVAGTINGSAFKCGYVSITPVANTPTKIHISTSFSGTPRICVTANSTVIGTTVKGASIANQNSTGFDIYINRSNTTATSVNWIAVVG